MSERERLKGVRKVRDKLLKFVLSCAAASASIYFKKLFAPVAMLIFAMVADYISGITAAWFEGTLNSKTGKKGAVKKVCYMLLVVASGIIDWVIAGGLAQIGIELTLNFYFGTVVTIWLILNELLSILENCTRIGLPIPKFIKPLAEKLKIAVEERAADE